MEMMDAIVAWFGWGNGIGAVAAVSAILTVAVILAPVVIGLVLFALERLQIELIGLFNRDIAYLWVNFLTFPGTFVHEMSHVGFGILTGAEIDEVCMFESDDGRVGHVGFSNRGPWPVQALQNTLGSAAPTIVGLGLGYLLIKHLLTAELSVWGYIGYGYLAFCLIDHSAMSDADLGHYFAGVWIFVLPLFLVFFVLGM